MDLNISGTLPKTTSLFLPRSFETGRNLASPLGELLHANNSWSAFSYHWRDITGHIQHVWSSPGTSILPNRKFKTANYERSNTCLAGITHVDEIVSLTFSHDMPWFLIILIMERYAQCVVPELGRRRKKEGDWQTNRQTEEITTNYSVACPSIHGNEFMSAWNSPNSLAVFVKIYFKKQLILLVTQL